MPQSQNLQIWATGQIWAISFCYTQSFAEAQPHPFICTLSVAAFTLQSSWVVVTETYVVSQVALVVKNPSVNVGDLRDRDSIPRLERYPEGRHSNPLQYSCLESPMDRAWWATAQGVTKSQTRLEQLSTHTATTKTYGSQSRKHLPSGSSHTKIFHDHYHWRN